MEKVAEVLAGLRDEEARLRVELAGVQRAIGALEEVLGIAPPAQPQPASVTASTPAPEPPSPEPEPPGPYATCSLYDAVALYLAEAGEPRTAREIAEALQAGGYPTLSRDFTATVRTMLQRDPVEYGIERTDGPGLRWFFKG